jgi:hypothetical protein
MDPKIKILAPHLQFRFWCSAGNAYISDYKYSGLVEELFQSDLELLIPQQCTGLKDNQGHWVYEGDIVSFKYKIKPEVLETMQSFPEHRKHLVKLNGKTLKGTIERDPCCPSNLVLVCPLKNGLIRMLPLEWVKHCKIVGNELVPPSKKKRPLRKPKILKVLKTLKSKPLKINKINSLKSIKTKP